ncbi:g6507 [Coccomyxa viridis]|uniref:G6507 protein n=1 Tax=Coccomyxa viridis TaxID=1274662 RepID=A0ABP1FVI2_9CHLO
MQSSGSLSLVPPWLQEFSRGAPGIPYWEWAAGALAAGGLYYAFTRQQKAEVEAAPHNAGDRQSQKVTRDTPTVATKEHSSQAKLPSFQAFEVTDSDLRDSFNLLVFVNPADYKKALENVRRLQDVVELADVKSNLQMMTPVVMDMGTDQQASGSGLDKVIKDFIETERRNKKGKTELRLQGLTGHEAAEKVKDAMQRFASKVAGESSKAKVIDETVLHLIGPDGEVLVQYEATAPKDQVAQSVADEMIDYSRRNPVWSGVKSVKGRHA